MSGKPPQGVAHCKLHRHHNPLNQTCTRPGACLAPHLYFAHFKHTLACGALGLLISPRRVSVHMRWLCADVHLAAPTHEPSSTRPFSCAPHDGWPHAQTHAHVTHDRVLPSRMPPSQANSEAAPAQLAPAPSLSAAAAVPAGHGHGGGCAGVCLERARGICALEGLFHVGGEVVLLPT